MKPFLPLILVLSFAAVPLLAEDPAPTPATPPTVAEDVPETPAAAATGAKVDKLVLCTGIENREPDGEATTFDSSIGKVYCWTRLTADSVPAQAKHVWYADGKVASEVPLTIKGSPFRTWSYKTVWPGQWKVEVQDGAGTVLSSADFTVTQGAPAKTPASTTPPDLPPGSPAAPDSAPK